MIYRNGLGLDNQEGFYKDDENDSLPELKPETLCSLRSKQVSTKKLKKTTGSHKVKDLKNKSVTNKS